MPFYEKGSLQKLVDTDPHLSWKKSVKLLTDAAKGSVVTKEIANRTT